MSQDAPILTCEPAFYYLAKFEGDPKPKLEQIGEYESLCMDLLNPQCVELVVGGKDRPTQVWRK